MSAGIILLVIGCAPERSSVTLFGPDDIPHKLRDWNLLVVDDRALSLNERVVPYELNTPLFSDYALKLRTVWMPAGTTAKYSSDREFDFPVGTIISKTFHYERAVGDVDGTVTSRVFPPFDVGWNHPACNRVRP